MRRSAACIHAIPINIICGTIAVIFGWAASTALAGVNDLTSLGPEGGGIIDVEFHRTQPGVVYMAAPPGVFRSTDGGSSWQLIRANFLNSDLVYDIAVDPTDSERVYLAAGEGLFVSQDGGSTFSRALLPSRQGLLIRIKCGSDGVVYAPDGAHMYRSQDLGQSWQKAGSYPNAHDFTHALAVDPTDSRIVYASLFGEGLFVSQDSGATWAPATANAAIWQTMDIEIDRTNPLRLWAATLSGVYKSDNAGADWTQALADSGFRVEIDPVNSQLVYATGGFSHTLMRTTDGGANWSALPQHFGSSTLLPGLAIHPTQPERMIAFSDGIWLSSDAGTLWTRGNTGVVATGIQRIVPARGTSRRYLATTSSGIHRLDDNNIPRAVDNARLGALSTRSSVEIVDLAVTPTATLDTLVTIFAVDQLARSVDGGAQWQSIARPAFSAHPFSLALSPGAPVTLYIGTSEGVFSSVDLGDHWAPANTGLPNGTVMQRLVSTSDPAVIYGIGADPAGGSARVFRTADRAQSWTATALPAGLISGLAVHPSDPQTVYVGHEQRLSRTTDGGATWVEANVDTDHYIDVAVDPSDARVVYASASQRLIRSTDGGATWERLVVPQNFYAFSTAVAVDPVAQNSVLVGSIGLGLRQLSIRPDVQLTVAAPASMTANVIGTFTLQVQNRGPYHARDVRVVMQLPATASNISASVGAGSCSVTGQQAVCTFESLKADTTATIALNAAGSSGPFSVQASVTANEADLNAANNSASAQVTVGAAPAPPSNSGGGGGGGGGAMQLLMLLALSGLAGLGSGRLQHSTER